ncbi:MAG: SAM-dependent methyltransferase [Nitrospinaceae bacterium]
MPSFNVKTAYLAAPRYQSQLERELKGAGGVHGRLLLSGRPAVEALWAQNIWRNPDVVTIESINDAVRKLKARRRRWANYPAKLHRRSALIQEKLTRKPPPPVNFPSPLPENHPGSWTLLDANTLLMATDCSSPFPNGEVEFAEDKTGPPNRAYLKFWEACLRMQAHPTAADFCVDAGGSPGGWAWSAARLGARVLSVDRAPLDPKVLSLQNVEFRRGNAFALRPGDFDRVDWLLCDVVCYPAKLYDWLGEWLGAGKCRYMVATLKFQGDPDYNIAKKFAALPGSRVLHLHHNKHELTWMWKGEDI